MKQYGGYGYGMIAKNEKLGERPCYEDIRLRPGKADRGRLVNPEGPRSPGSRSDAFCTDPEAKTKDPNEFGLHLDHDRRRRAGSGSTCSRPARRSSGSVPGTMPCRPTS